MPLRIGCRADDSDKHEFDINSLLFHKGKLYSCADDGKVKVWSSDLTKQGEVRSNPCSVYSLAASDDTVYSCSNEGTIKGFELDTLKEKTTVVRDKQLEFWKLVYANGCLYSGDHEGNIKVWKHNAFYGVVNVADPIKDLAVFNNLVFSVKDLDLVITDMKLSTDIKLAGEKIQYGTVQDFSGRAPIALIGDKYFAFLNREGRDIIIHEINPATKYKEVTKIPAAGEKIINAMVGAKWNDKFIIFTGGWDKIIKKWILEGGVAKLDSSIEVDIIINAIALGEAGEIYVGGSDGHIVRIEVE